MLIIEKMETTLESIRDKSLKAIFAESAAGTALTERKDALVESFQDLKLRFTDAMPFANETDFIKLEKKVTQMNRKMNQLKKKLIELDN